MKDHKDYRVFWPTSFDAYTPAQMYHKVQEFTETQLLMPQYKQLMLGILAGVYIGLGCIFFIFMQASDAASNVNLFLSGLVFSSGYIISILAGAEVFTSNNLQAMSWASGKIPTRKLLHRWVLILFANSIGAFALAILVLLSGILTSEGVQVGEFAFDMAHQHTQLGFCEIFFRAVLGNVLICISIWISFAGRTVTDKLIPMAIIISAVPILNLEHITASLFYVPLGVLLPLWHPDIFEPACQITLSSTSVYLTAVTLGNILGGSGMVALVYFVIYRGNS